VSSIDVPTSDAAVLDNPAWASLNGPHARFAERKGRIVRYPVDVSPFLAIPDDFRPADRADLAALVGPGALVPLAADDLAVSDGWEVVARVDGVQLTGELVPEPAYGGAFPAEPGEDWVRLEAADVPEMLELIERTRPGPFLPRTIELGTYVGVRHEGALVAMAGERLRPPGWTEISAVCTDVAFRGRGLGARLVLDAVARVRARGEQPFLHAAAENTGAIRLYRSLGFRLRRTAEFVVVRVPEL